MRCGSCASAAALDQPRPARELTNQGDLGGVRKTVERRLAQRRIGQHIVWKLFAGMPHDRGGAA